MRKVPLIGLDHQPSGWDELRGLLWEAMIHLMVKWGNTEAVLTLERHLRKAATPAPQRYGVRMLRWKRQYDAWFRCSLNPRTRRLTIRSAGFSPELEELEREYRLTEKGEYAKRSPIIPRRILESRILDPRSLEPSGLRYPDYRPREHYTYGWFILQEDEETPPKYSREAKPQYERRPRNL